MPLSFLNDMFRKKKPSPPPAAAVVLDEKFPELFQGQVYLKKQQQVLQQMQANLKLIESVQPKSTLQNFSCKDNDCSPRYGYYPSK